MEHTVVAQTRLPRRFSLRDGAARDPLILRGTSEWKFYTF